MKPLTMLMIAAGAGVVIWAVADAKGLIGTAKKGRKAIEGATGFRLPRPDVKILLTTPEDFQSLNESIDTAIDVVCARREAADGLRAHGADPMSLEWFADAVAKEALSEMFPDFPWPAITGDHHTALEVQGAVLYRILAGDLAAWCSAEPLSPIDELEDELGMDDGYLVYQPYDEPPTDFEDEMSLA